MKIHAMSRQEFKQLIQALETDNSSLKGINAYIISIHSDSPVIDDKVEKMFKEIGVKGYLSLDFDDLTPKEIAGVEPTSFGISYSRSSGDYVLFNTEHAKKIVDMFEDIKKSSDFANGLKNTVLIVHCYAGISRSGAVSSMASRYFHGCVDLHEFMRDNPQIQPNYYVYSLLLEEITDRQTKNG